MVVVVTAVAVVVDDGDFQNFQEPELFGTPLFAWVPRRCSVFGPSDESPDSPDGVRLGVALPVGRVVVGVENNPRPSSQGQKVSSSDSTPRLANSDPVEILGL